MARSETSPFSLPKKKPAGVQMAGNLSEDQIRLNQLLYDRRLSAKGGLDVKNDTYAPNAEIERLRKILKGG